MSVLTIIYAGQTHYNGEVESVSIEMNAKGDIFVAASTEPPVVDGVEGATGEPIDPLNPDGRFTDAELAILRKRNVVNPQLVDGGSRMVEYQVDPNG